MVAVRNPATILQVLAKCFNIAVWKKPTSLPVIIEFFLNS